MPTVISNAIGTAQQFTPRPDATYQGHYQGVSPIQSQASVSRDAELAMNLSRLGDALSNYLVSHEKFKDEMGHIRAERMVSSMSPDDIKRLNTIDAAQQYGYADATANPYFKAYAEKIRGGFLSAQMKLEYDQKYGMTPARTMEEETARYNKFTSEWKESNLTGDSAPVNKTAFNDGFTESNLVNMNNLAETWSNTKHKEEVVNTVAYTKSKLGEIIANSGEWLKENGKVTEAVQEVFNTARLMGVPVEYRQQMVEDFAQQFISTGHIDAKRFEQMAKKLVVQTSIDGTTTSMADMINMQTYKTMAAKYNASYLSEAHYQWGQRFIKMGKAGKVAMLKDIDASTPEDRLWKSQMAGSVFGQIEANISKQEAARRAALSGRLGGGGGRNGKKLTDPQDMNILIDTWLNGGTHIAGIPLKNYSVDDEAFYPVFDQRLQKAMTDGDTNAFNRLITIPQATGLRETLNANYSSILDNIRPTTTSATSTTISDSGNTQVKGLLLMMMNNTRGVQALFGGSVAEDAMLLKQLDTATGNDTDMAIRRFAEYKALDEETRRNYEKSWDDNGFIDKGLAGVARIATRGSNSTGLVTDEKTKLSEPQNSLLASSFKRLYTAIRSTGTPPDRAWEKVLQAIKENYYAYHGGLYPRSCSYNLGMGDANADDAYFVQALNQTIYEADPSGNNYDAVIITYNPETQTFYSRLPGSSQEGVMTLATARLAAQEQYERDAKANAVKNPTADNLKEDIQKINAYRKEVAEFEQEQAGGPGDPNADGPVFNPAFTHTLEDTANGIKSGAGWIGNKVSSAWHKVFG